jgi:hypothetical protein
MTINHIALQIIQDLDISDETAAYKRVKDLADGDINAILDKMDSWYRTQNNNLSQEISAKKTVFDFWIPTPTSQSLSKLTANLLFADSVVLSDPLYDHLCFISGGAHIGAYIQQKKKLEGTHICNTCSQEMDNISLDIYREKIAEIIIFYLKVKPLIEKGTVIPYVSPQQAPWQLTEIPLADVVKEYDESVAEFLKLQEKNQEQVLVFAKKSNHSINQFSLPLFKTGIGLGYDSFLATIAVGDVLLNPVTAPSIDFLENVSDGIFRGLVKQLRRHGAISKKNSFTPSTYENAFMLPTLSGVPIQAISEIVYKEKDSLEQFKASINTKILAISAPPGSREWEQQIESMRNALNRDLIELERTLTHIKQDHLKRQAENIALLGFSVAMASLTLINQTLDPLTAITGVASGAGLTSSLKNIFDVLIDRQQKIDEQKRKDVFFLWRLKHAQGK